MTKERKKRTDSAAAQTEIMKGALEPPMNPPLGQYLDDDARKHWDIIIKGKAKMFWTDQDLLFAVELARNLANIEDLSRSLRDGQYLGEDGKVNPKYKLLNEMVTRSRAVAAFLKLHPEATQGKSGVVAKTNKIHNEAMNAIDAIDDEDNLIPGLH